MFRYFRIFLNIFKSLIKPIVRSINGARYYHGVNFFNPKNIAVEDTAVIETGTRLWAISPQPGEINISVKSNCWIGRDVEIQTVYNSTVTLDNYASVQDRCKLLGHIYIGQNSLLAPDVFLSSGSHYYDIKPARLIKEQDKLVIKNAEDFKKNNKRIIIGEDCWIGKNVMIQRGVTIGRGSIIAANSFVRRSVPPYEIWGGTPAIFLKKRLEFAPPDKLDCANEDNWPFFYFGFEHRNIQDGFMGGKSSVCVLRRSNPAFVSIEGIVKEQGSLKIWINDILLFDKELPVGELIENLNVDSLHSSNVVDNSFYELLQEERKIYNLIYLNFLPVNNKVSQGFSLYKVSQND